MYKSYRKDGTNKQRIGLNGYNNHMFKGKAHKKNIYKTILKQLLICILIIATIILIKSINTPITNTISMAIKTTIEKEFDYKHSVKSVFEYASNFKEETQKITNTISVFNEESSDFEFQLPIEGRISSTYGEKYDPLTEKKYFQRGIDIHIIEDKTVKSIEEGVVETVGESQSLGKFVKVQHNERMFSLYSNLDSINVKEEDIVKRGGSIGEILKESNTYLHFELWIDNEAVDPQLYLKYDNISI